MARGGGPIRELNLNGRDFTVAQDSEGNRRLGGDQNTIEMDGDGVNFRIVKEVVSWQEGPFAVTCDDERGDLEFLQELANRSDPFSITITYWDRTIYQATGTIVDETVKSSKNGTAPITLAGGGKLTKQ